MDRAVFMGMVRRSNFGGRLTAGQVEGLGRILDWRDIHWPKQSDEELAYVLATAQWETAHSMQPVEEGYPLQGRRLLAYQRKLAYYPWFGRGLVQLTHKVNYDKFRVSTPEDALKWDVSLRVMFDGMIFGRFRGPKLADFITPEKQDYVMARSIVNGRPRGAILPDRAKEIAALAVDYLAALRASRASPYRQPPARKVKSVQERLRSLNYHVGRIDGVLGEATAGAISKFQFTNALPVTGQLDDATMKALMSEQAAPSEVADARAQDTTVEGSTSLQVAKNTTASGYGLLGAVAAWATAGGHGALPAAVAIIFSLYVLHLAKRAAAVRLDDHKSGANLGR